MLLNNITLVDDSKPVSINISKDNILSLGKVNETVSFDNINIHFENAIAFPGLINSHDHLDFNCFSILGNEIYTSYTEWGKHIHTAYKEEINAVLKIPQHLRTKWGMYKNLFAGVTTVINHGDLLNIDNPLINIYQQTQNLHSVKFQKKWRWKLNNPFLTDKPCVIHTGEGTDRQSANEINHLLQWNLLNRKLIGIHGVAMNAVQAKKFEALVWCPESNRVLLNKHADIKTLKSKTRIVFGTDSTLTGNWNIWQHLRLARKLKLATDDELFNMVTKNAAQLWNFNNGDIQAGKDADIVIAKTKNSATAMNNFFSINPSDILMVIQKGKIRLFDESLLDQMIRLPLELKNYSDTNLNGSSKFVEGNLPDLIRTIKHYYPAVALPVDDYETAKIPQHD